MIETVMKSGDSKAIEKSEALVSEALEYVKKHSPETYDNIVRGVHETVCGKHYSEEFAKEDVAKLHYSDQTGAEHNGPHWTFAEVMSATSKYDFPKGTTDWDKYVAFNAAYADYNTKFTDAQILDIGYLSYFKDEDWKSDGKIWDYMNLNR